jgi:hypothetical protein
VAVGEPLDPDDADLVAEAPLVPVAVVAVGVVGDGALTVESDVADVVVIVVDVVVGAVIVVDGSVLPTVAVVVAGAVPLVTVSDDEGADVVESLGPLTTAVVVDAAALEEASEDAVEVVADGSLDVAVWVADEGSSDAEKN